jgi:prophage regulatory protein
MVHMSLPDIGYVRLSQIIGCPRRGIPAVIPVSPATWWRKVASGEYPAGHLISARIRVWSVESIRELVAQMAVHG